MATFPWHLPTDPPSNRFLQARLHVHYLYANATGALQKLQPLGVHVTWPFDQAPNVAAITTVGVLELKLPILVVQHYEDDHSWAFLCGTASDTEDGRVIGMGEVLKSDKSLSGIADLKPGWIARRSFVGGEWRRELDLESDAST